MAGTKFRRSDFQQGARIWDSVTSTWIEANSTRSDTNANIGTAVGRTGQLFRNTTRGVQQLSDGSAWQTVAHRSPNYPGKFPCNGDIVSAGAAAQAMSANLTPILYPVQARGFPWVPLEKVGVRVTTLLAASTIGVAFYRFNWTGTGTFNATRLTFLSTALSGAANGEVESGTGFSPPFDLSLFTDDPFDDLYVGLTVSNIATLRIVGTNGPGSDGTLVYGSTVANTVTWPSTFTQAAVSSAGTAINRPYIYIVTTKGLRWL